MARKQNESAAESEHKQNEQSVEYDRSKKTSKIKLQYRDSGHQCNSDSDLGPEVIDIVQCVIKAAHFKGRSIGLRTLTFRCLHCIQPVRLL